MGKPRNPRYDEAVRLYAAGKSIEEVAAAFSISRQAMHKILRIRGVHFRPQPRFGEENIFFRDGMGYMSHQIRARAKVSKAVRGGRLVPQPCEVCGLSGKYKNGRNMIEAHHDDYSKPLEVRWLCRKHHYEADRATDTRAAVEAMNQTQSNARGER